MLWHAPFENKHIFLVLDRSLKSHVLCRIKVHIKQIQIFRWKRSDHLSPQLITQLFLVLLELILSQLHSRDSWIYVAAAVAVALPV